MDLFFLLVLYVSFRAKHFSCDFLLQTDWMALNKGKPGMEGYRALIPHIAIHSIGTLIILLIFAPNLWWLSILDFFVHGIIDRVKGVFGYKKKWATDNKIFWWVFGVDQELHNLTHLSYVVIIFTFLNGTLSF